MKIKKNNTLAHVFGILAMISAVTLAFIEGTIMIIPILSSMIFVFLSFIFFEDKQNDQFESTNNKQSPKHKTNSENSDGNPATSF